MKLALVADGRSPHTRSWLDLIGGSGHEVHLISTFRCEPPDGLASYRVVPVALSGRARPGAPGQAIGGASAINLRAAIRHWLGPLSIPYAASRLRAELAGIQPDLVHALRIPFEGMLAAAAGVEAALVISVWGNDFTLHASASPLMAFYTRRALRSADGLHTDCERDLHLAYEWGYRPENPAIVLPGGGGIDTDIFHPGEPDPGALEPPLRETLQAIGPDAPVVVNPRGFRAYVRNDTFFQAIPGVLRVLPEAIFLCPAMAGEAEAERWIGELGIEASVRLLPMLSSRAMAAVYQRAWVMVSPSEHDGTPNSFLEAIACGTFPVVSDLESLREWIEDGSNGLLTSASDPDNLSHSIVLALQNERLRANAGAINQALIEERASRVAGLSKVEGLYTLLAPGQGAMP
jgi:glycosyltransferase involved in cell wall biosynthesis